jgi:molybdopterin molybdotransferase
MTDVRMKGFAKRTLVSEAHALIDQRVSQLGLERVPFSHALGRVLAEDVVASRDVPEHAKSAMDGYAVRASDLPGTLAVIGEIKAAEQLARAVGKGEAVRIMTGAKVPEGADAVVMAEDAQLDGDRVEIQVEPQVGQHILRIGEDLARGKPVLRAGRRLRPQDVSMLVMVDALEVAVRRRPRVRIVPTGTELVRAGTHARGSEVVESNSFMLQGLAVRDGAEPILHPIVKDDPSLLERALLEPGADVVVMTGGSSVGKEDFGPVVMRKIGELPIHGVHAKPASPTGIGFLGSTAVVLAPGYPVASYVAWDLFVRPIVQRMLGLDPHLPYATTRARLAKTLQKPAEQTMIVRVVLNETSSGPPMASALPGGAALLSTVTRADGFVHAPEGVTELTAGVEVEVHLY